MAMHISRLAADENSLEQSNWLPTKTSQLRQHIEALNAAASTSKNTNHDEPTEDVQVSTQALERDTDTRS
ncbi:uncharacterized protein EKO05_0003413 [Ascochyta rabiei]|uniref:Uncharacterized protein n=1 Tax=Didymella rabiei TaxID=5454 RepID=A0A163EAB1_DIDRA|nr:uncharacterized protein EKO05_0003413 [Ascochyta rabiei]KZM23598.1 hypothetical protein ST47_g5270 [Ascochyta rabiei]UPX12878.1 hypothetical protein EKO05_0003413 [Ascochyta rabiei]